MLSAVLTAVTEPVVTAGDLQRASHHQHPGQLSSGGCIDLLYGGACYAHPFSAGFLGKALLVNESDGLIFIHRQNDG